MKSPAIVLLALIAIQPPASAAPTVSFDRSHYSVMEGEAVSIHLVTEGDWSSGRTVAIRISGGTARYPHDWTASFPWNVWLAPAGERRVREAGVISVRDDGIKEEDETIELTLSSLDSSLVVGAVSTTVITILNRPPTVFIWGDGREGEANASITISRSGDSEDEVTVDYRLEDCSAITGIDYRAHSGTVALAPGQIYRSISVANPVIDNFILDGPRYARAHLFNPRGPAGVRLQPGRFEVGDNEFVNWGAFRYDARLGRGTLLAGVDREGNMLVVTRMAGQPGLLRLKSDGSIDARFRFAELPAKAGEHQRVWQDHVFPREIRALEQADGRWVIGLSYETRESAAPRLFRLLADGAADPGFGPAETRTRDMIHALALQANGKLLAAASGQVVRLNRDGSEDLSFSPIPCPVPDSSDPLPAILPREDGRIAVVTWDADEVPLVRSFDRNGAADPGFSAPVFRRHRFSQSPPCAAALQSDGRIIVSGAFEAVNSGERLLFARLNADGSLDETWSLAEAEPGRIGRWQILQPEDRFVTTLRESSRGKDCLAGLAILNRDGSMRSRHPVVQLWYFAALTDDIILQTFNGFLIEPWEGARGAVYDLGRIREPGAMLFETSDEARYPWIMGLAESDAFDFPVRRTGDIDQALAVRVSSVERSAKAGEDYAFEDQVLSFGPGESLKMVTLTPVQNDRPQPDREGLLRLTEAGTGAWLNERAFAILDDDPGRFFSAIQASPWNPGWIYLNFNAPADESWQVEVSSNLRDWSGSGLEGLLRDSIRRHWTYFGDELASPASLFFRAVRR